MIIFSLCFGSLRPLSIGFASTGHPCYFGIQLLDESHLVLARKWPCCIKLRKFTEFSSKIDDNARKHSEHHRCHRGVSSYAVTQIGRKDQHDLGPDRLGEALGGCFCCGRTRTRSPRTSRSPVCRRGGPEGRLFGLANELRPGKVPLRFHGINSEKHNERQYARHQHNSRRGTTSAPGSFSGSCSSRQSLHPGNRLECVLVSCHRANFTTNRCLRKGPCQVPTDSSAARLHVIAYINSFIATSGRAESSVTFFYP